MSNSFDQFLKLFDAAPTSPLFENKVHHATKRRILKNEPIYSCDDFQVYRDISDKYYIMLTDECMYQLPCDIPNDTEFRKTMKQAKEDLLIRYIKDILK